jgi:chemotaxis-related protein WspB
MLLILCHAGANRYAVEAQLVKEVLPGVGLKRVSQSPRWSSGLLIHRGAAIPVMDLVQLTQGKPCPNRLSSRIVVLEVEINGSPRKVGILAERVGLRESSAGISETGEGLDAKSGLGRLLLDDEGVLELLDVARLVGDDWQASAPGLEAQSGSANG